jgi:putative ABC transport system permease protein
MEQVKEEIRARRRGASLSNFFMDMRHGFNIRIGDRVERVLGVRATPEWLSILGAKPLLGRTFTPDETEPGRSNVVVLGWSFWNSHYQQNPSVIGRSMVIDGTPRTINGVLPKETAHLEHEEFWVPAVFDGPNAQSRGTRSWVVAGRIAPGLSLAAAERRMNDLNERLVRQYPNEEGGQSLRLQPIEEAYVENVKPVLLLVFGAVGFVLLIACAIIANLFLVVVPRAGRRSRSASLWEQVVAALSRSYFRKVCCSRWLVRQWV